MDAPPNDRDAFLQNLQAKSRANLIRDFNRLYYDSHDQTWLNTRFFNVPLYKNPCDLWIYQELITETAPELILETGTAYGGSALYLASLCQLLGRGEVLTVDIQAQADPKHPRPQHPLITYLTGSSTDPSVVVQVHARAAGKKCLVILDSDHQRDHVLVELYSYAPLVPVGGYVIVEDTNVNGHPSFPSHGPGPWEAVEAFLAECPDFEPDQHRERFLLTQNPNGYLKRVRETT